LTDRDKALLYYLWQNQFTSIRQVRLRFWGSGAKGNISTRLATLEKAGLLRVVSNRFLRTVAKDRKVVVIGLGGLDFLIENEILPKSLARDTPAARSLPSDHYAPAMYHDLQVVDMRIALETSLSVQDWTSDHQLRLARKAEGRNVRVPDGLFTFSTAQGEAQGVLENERARYSSKTYRDVLARLRGQYPAAVVLIVCTTPERVQTMKQWALTSRLYADRPQLLLFAAFEDVASHGAAAAWETLEGPLEPQHPLRQGAQHFLEDPA
jgi:hypothetical protein